MLCISRGYTTTGVFGSMQFVDTLLWYDATLAGGALESCDMLNRIVTRVGICIICCEPLAALWGAYRYHPCQHDDRNDVCFTFRVSA